MRWSFDEERELYNVFYWVIEEDRDGVGCMFIFLAIGIGSMYHSLSQDNHISLHTVYFSVFQHTFHMVHSLTSGKPLGWWIADIALAAD